MAAFDGPAELDVVDLGRQVERLEPTDVEPAARRASIDWERGFKR